MNSGLSIILLFMQLVPIPFSAAATDSGIASVKILRRAVVPSAEQPQGEVQIVLRDGRPAVRTLLASSLLKRVAAAIDEKERRRWPEESDGFVASQRYRDELYAAAMEVWKRFRARADNPDPRQYLGIDFIAEQERGRIELFVPVLQGDFGNLSVQEAESLSRWQAPEAYVQENMIAIIADSFGVDPATAAGLLDSSQEKH